ncbi:hypothetical protein GCM10007063_12440 [Lentibacillus kapialis]|uniref:chitinase n=1 Tax=Lentibacillus kapialis TaxID=340214 RepID=A0A917UW99_9BACI|nr:glycoside hydrolase family 18 protein [Lentibacillus kapialis]GGJ91313.1 hypothetical protein GCM10007063_12440 [Lentibacillus kapialis]
MEKNCTAYLKKVLMVFLLFVLFVPLLNGTKQVIAESAPSINTEMNGQPGDQVITSVQTMKTLVKRFKEEGNITNDKAARKMQMHLAAIEQFNEDGNNNKAVKHLKGFKNLIAYQKDNGSISEKAYNVLKSDAEYLIQEMNKGDDAIVAGYWTGDEKLENFPAKKLTHINYAFAYVNKEGKSELYPGAEKDIKELNTYKENHPHIKSLISIGGWGKNSKYFSDVAATSKSRETFARSTINKFIKKNQFDGIDLDWEFPVKGGIDELHYSPEDKRNLTLLVKEFRDQLDQLEKKKNRDYLLTAATPAGRYQNGGPYDPADSYEFEELSKYLDWIYVMTYDLANGFSPVTNFNTPMQPVDADPTPNNIKKWNNVSGAIKYYQQKGVPRNKIVLGTAFYGRSFEVSNSANHGLYQEYKSTGPSPSWEDIKKDYLTDLDWKKYWHSTAEVPWLFNSRTNMFLTYDNPESISKKGHYINEHNLRGGMIWTIGHDDKEHNLLKSLANPVLEDNR